MPRSVVTALGDKHDPFGALVPALAEELGADPIPPETIHYFHGTRAFDPKALTDTGLLPLPDVLDVLWSRVHELVPELPLGGLERVRRAMSEGAVEPVTYTARVNDTIDIGPNGHLVRDVLLWPDAYGAWDYLGGAEIVVDICSAVGRCLGADVLARYQQRTTPCIVEFVMEAQHVDRALAAAAWYVDAAARGEHTTNANWGHDGRGEVIPPEAIVSVTVVDRP